MPSLAQYTLKDWSNENSNVTVHVGDITAVSLPGFLTEFGDLRDAIDAITLGTVHKERWVGDDTLISSALPGSEEAQREKKWLVTYTGDTLGRVYQIEIPTALLTGHLVAGSDLANMASANMIAFVAAFEQIARAPDDVTSVETVTIQSIRYVGRNL